MRTETLIRDGIPVTEQEYDDFSFNYINSVYGLEAKTGQKVKFDGDPGKIVGAKGHYLLVMLDNDTRTLIVHPTWKMEYFK